MIAGMTDKQFLTAFNRVERWGPYINELAVRYKVDPKLIRSIIILESRGIPTAYNEKSRAAGLMQMVPGTSKFFGVTDPTQLYDPLLAIETGTKYLRDLVSKTERYGSSIDHVAAAYNAGDVYFADSGLFTNQKYVNDVKEIYMATIYGIRKDQQDGGKFSMPVLIIGAALLLFFMADKKKKK